MTISTIPVVVAGTGRDGRANIIRAHCKEGAAAEVHRNLTNPNADEALEVWLQCRYLFGLVTAWKKIGYVEGGRYATIARELENGRLRVRRSVVNSFFAPLDREHPQVALELEVEWTPRHAESRERPSMSDLIRQR